MAGADELEEMPDSMHGAMSLDGDVDKLRTFYDDWASTYDADVNINYGMPGMVVETLRQAVASRTELSGIAEPHAHIIDAGCGTGAIGTELAKAGWVNVHGIDLSHEMLKKAEERGVYASLTGGVDLTVPVGEELAATADAVTVGGVFTVGHVPPEALGVMASIVRPGGVLATSVRDAYVADTNFADVQQQLCDTGALELLLLIEGAPYTMDSTGDYYAWKVL